MTSQSHRQVSCRVVILVLHEVFGWCVWLVYVNDVREIKISFTNTMIHYHSQVKCVSGVYNGL